MEAPPNYNATLLYAAAATLGEGALWQPHTQQLLWVDIEKCELHSFDPVTGKDVCWPMPARIGTVVPVNGGGYLIALETGIYFFDPNHAQMRFMVNPITGPQLRFNDGKCDPLGNFWAGTIQMEGKKHQAALYRYDPQGRLHTMLTGVSNSNGIVWSADGQTMYYIDTPTQTVQAFDFDRATAQISGPRIAVRIPEEAGAPDGMSIDAADRLWVCLYGGGAVHCYDPKSGNLICRVKVPAPNTTSCAFGGSDLKTLFITTARENMSPAALRQFPDSGGIFALQTNVAGVPASYFG